MALMWSDDIISATCLFNYYTDAERFEWRLDVLRYLFHINDSPATCLHKVEYRPTKGSIPALPVIMRILFLYTGAVEGFDVV